MRPRTLALTVLTILVACGNGKDADSTKSINCSPSGSSLEITARNSQFDKNCLAVSSGEAFTIALENKDPDTHNVAIYKDRGAGEKLFVGKLFSGPKTETYEVEALDAGSYYFRCDTHPEMNGTFIVV
jgi:plastocyanin